MPVFDKAIQAAAGPARNRKTDGQPSEINPQPVVAEPSPGVALLSPDSFFCFGHPADFSGFTRHLTELTASLWSGTVALFDDQQPAPQGRFLLRSYSGPNGTRSYKLFLPDHAAPPTALVLMLHGCSQNADDFAVGTRMNEIARRHNVLVIYPEQSRSANSSACWNWFEPRDQHRESGEPALLAGLTAGVAEEFSLGPGRCFVAGLSAGGAMAAILAETYPDRFAAAGIHSGLAYGAACDLASAFSAMNNGAKGGSGASPAADQPKRNIPLIIIHGDADRTVHPDNADAIVAQMKATEPRLRIDTTHGTAAGGRSYVKTVGRNGKGAVRFEYWRLVGGGHAWSGGSRIGSFADAAGPDASAEMIRFFLDRRR